MVRVGLAGAFECDLVLRDFAALADWWSLGMWIGLGFSRWLRNLVGVDRMNTSDWSNHGGLLKVGSAPEEADFSRTRASCWNLSKCYHCFIVHLVSLVSALGPRKSKALLQANGRG